MTHDEADSFTEKYAKEVAFTQVEEELIESHSIETLMGTLQSESDYMLLEKICVQFRIQDVSEFNLERLSQKYLAQDQITVMHVKNQTYQLFYKEQYLISKMNPYQLAVIFNNLKGLRYLTIKLNKHLRMCIDGPEFNFGGLQIENQNKIEKECWCLFVAIHNMSLKMLMFLWQDLGNVYNTSIGTGYGNINSEIQLRLGQDKNYAKLGFTKDHELMQRPIMPAQEQSSIRGNGNRSNLWGQSHLKAVVKILTEHKFTDGLKFILSCSATHDIYQSMSFESKVDFLQSFLTKQSQESIMDIEVREILKLKLTEAPYSAVSVFVMVNVDLEAFLISTSSSRKIKPQERKLASNTIR